MRFEVIKMGFLATLAGLAASCGDRQGLSPATAEPQPIEHEEGVAKSSLALVDATTPAAAPACLSPGAILVGSSVMVLGRGESMDAGSKVSFDRYGVSVAVQGDGNFVTYRVRGNTSTAIWNTASINNARIRKYLLLQNDGNLVLIHGNGTAWNSGTFGKGATQLRLMKDGRLVLIGNAGNQVWSSTPIEPSCGVPVVPNRVVGASAATVQASLWGEVLSGSAKCGAFPRLTNYGPAVRVCDRVPSGRRNCYEAMRMDGLYIVPNSVHQVCQPDGSTMEANCRFEAAYHMQCCPSP